MSPQGRGGRERFTKVPGPPRHLVTGSLGPDEVHSRTQGGGNHVPLEKQAGKHPGMAPEQSQPRPMT